MHVLFVIILHKYNLYLYLMKKKKNNNTNSSYTRLWKNNVAHEKKKRRKRKNPNYMMLNVIHNNRSLAWAWRKRVYFCFVLQVVSFMLSNWSVHHFTSQIVVFFFFFSLFLFCGQKINFSRCRMLLRVNIYLSLRRRVTYT